MFQGLDIVRKLRTIEIALLLIDNNFNSFNFAFSIAIIFSVFIMPFKFSSFCLSICMCILSSE